jgi:hypothetical protein
MTKFEKRMSAPDAVLPARYDLSATAKLPATHFGQKPTQTPVRRTQRVESRVEKELDAFWDNVPI